MVKKKAPKKRVSKPKIKPKVKPKVSEKLSRWEYNQALKHPKWQRKRLKVFERDKWKCTECGDKETTLHIHHLKYTKKYPWDEPLGNLKTVCSNCHRKTHNK